MAIGIGCDAAADVSQNANARLDALIDRELHSRHEDQLRREHKEAGHGDLGLQKDHAAKHAEENVALQQRLRHARSDEATNRFDLGEDERNLDVLRFRMGCARGRAHCNVNRIAQLPDCILADPGAVDAHHQLDSFFGKGDARVADCEPDDRCDGALIDGVIDDPSLELERRGAQQGHDDGQRRERKLMAQGIAADVAEDGWRQR